MKKSSEIKKLTLNRETLTQLESREIGQVLGGATDTACQTCITIKTTCC